MMTIAEPRVRPAQPRQSQRFGMTQSLVLFLVPALIFRVCIYTVMPALAKHTTAFDAFIVSYIVPLALLLVAALVGAKREHQPLSWVYLRERFWIKRLDRRGWLTTLACFLIGGLLTTALGFTARWLVQFAPFAPPAVFPDVIDPRREPTGVFTTFMGQATAGNWRMFGLYVLMFCFNILGEEAWWRGYILPRQEQVFGKYTWILHGILWTMFHVPFYPWQIVALLPFCLSLSYAVQKTRSIWAGIILHGVANGAAIIPLLLGVIG